MLALEGAHSLAESYINVASEVLKKGKMVDQLGETSKDFLSESRSRLTSEHQSLLSKYGNENDMAKDYQVRMQIMPPPNFIATMGANPVRPN